MAGVKKCQITLAVLSLLVALSWGTLISRRRHSFHLSVNEPDDPRFSLSNLARIANAQINAEIKGFNLPRFFKNPFAREPKCNSRSEFRTIDGTCNNLAKPFMGAAKTPLARLTANAYEDNINAPTATRFLSGGAVPEARIISLAIHDITSNISTRHSHLLVNFGQITDHDITLSPEAGGEGGEEAPKERCCEVSKKFWVNNLRECFALDTPNDPIFDRTCIPFLRSAITPGLPGTKVERFQLNDLTAYVDGSEIYGSTRRRALSLRTRRNGKLRSSEGLDGEERLPLAEDNPRNCFTRESECRFASGDVRNSEQAGLTSVHTLFLREHNRIAERIQALNPRMGDERIYQITRKIVGAVLQRITYREFVSEVVGPEIMRQYGLTLLDSGRFTGYSEEVDASIITEFSTAAFRFGHSMVRQTYSTSANHSIDIREAFDAFKTVDEFGSDALLGGLTRDNMEIRERFITKGLRDNLLGGEMDLPAFNIQRARDHGITSYNNIRRAFNLTVHDTFGALVGDTHMQDGADALRQVYPSTGDIEIFPGGLAEIKLQDAIVGETFAHIIGAQFRKLKFGDRFWHETDDTTTGFTDEQLAEIRKVSLASMFCENVPGASVRPLLLLAELPENPTVSCNEIPTMDFTPWRQ